MKEIWGFIFWPIEMGHYLKAESDRTTSSFFFFLNKLQAKCWAWTHNPEIKSHMFYHNWASQVPYLIIF